jgi:hypothetical protein
LVAIHARFRAVGILRAHFVEVTDLGEEILDAVLGVGEPLGEAGEEGSKEAAGEAGLTGLFRTGCARGREVFEFEVEVLELAASARF